MKYLILSLLLTPILIFSQITEDISGNTPAVKNKLYTKGSFMFGPGFEKVLVAEIRYVDSDKDPKKVHISPGGGAGIEAVIGYDLSKSLSCELAVGWQNSGDIVDKDNSAMFNKFPLRATVLYRIPINKKFTPYVGAGISTNIAAKYKFEGDPNETKIEINYNKPIGFNLLGGAEIKNSQSPWYWFGELRLIILGEYTVEESTTNGFSTTGLFEESELDNLNANGVQFTFGVGYYLK